MFHVRQLRIKLLKILQWESMGVYDFSIVKDMRLFGINTDLWMDPNLIPYPEFIDILSVDYVVPDMKKVSLLNKYFSSWTPNKFN